MKIYVEHYLDGWHEYDIERFKKHENSLTEELNAIYKNGVIPLVGDIICSKTEDDITFYKIAQRTVTSEYITMWIDDYDESVDIENHLESKKAKINC